MAKYIYQYKNWTDFNWQDSLLNSIFGEVRLMQGKTHEVTRQISPLEQQGEGLNLVYKLF